MDNELNSAGDDRTANNAVATGQLVTLADRDAAVGLVLAEAAELISGDDQHPGFPYDEWGNQIADTSERHAEKVLRHALWNVKTEVMSLRPEAPAALERALTRAREEERDRVVRIAASVFPGGYDANAARITAALTPLGGDA